MFEKYGAWTIVIGSVLPPPVPIAPFFVAPGALKYPLKKFLLAVAVGRSLRYTAVAYLGSIYGNRVFHWMYHYYRPLLYILLALAFVGGFVALYYWKRAKRHDRQETGKTAPTRKAA